jgi:hypothetical protein
MVLIAARSRARSSDQPLRSCRVAVQPTTALSGTWPAGHDWPSGARSLPRRQSGTQTPTVS